MDNKPDFYVECDKNGNWFFITDAGKVSTLAYPTKHAAIEAGIFILWN